MNPVHTAEHAFVPASGAAAVDMDCIDQMPLPYIELDAHGTIVRANRAALELYPPDHDQLIGQTAWDMVAPDEKDPSFAAYCSSLESGANPEPVNRSLYDRSGQFRTYQMHRSMVRDAQGNPTGMRMLCVDVTDSKKVLEDAHRRNLWLENVVDSILEAVILTDAVGFIRTVNPAAETLLGWPAAELQGMPIEQGLPIQAFLPGGCPACTFTTWLEGPMKGIATVLNRERQEVHIRIGASPIIDKENGSAAGVVLLLRKVEIRR